MFTAPSYHRLTRDWDEAARRVLARFRVNYGRAAGDPAFQQLVADLNAASPEFQRWWPQQDLLGQGEGVKVLCHPRHGEIEFEHTAFTVDAPAELRMIAYTPLPGARDRQSVGKGKSVSVRADLDVGRIIKKQLNKT